MFVYRLCYRAKPNIPVTFSPRSFHLILNLFCLDKLSDEKSFPAFKAKMKPALFSLNLRFLHLPYLLQLSLSSLDFFLCEINVRMFCAI